MEIVKWNGIFECCIEMEFEIEQVLKANYTNLQDKNQLQNMIVEHKSIINNLLKQIHELVNIKDKEQLERDIIVNKMQENMLENTRQIINFKNLVNQTTDEHHKLTKDFEEEKERNKKNAQIQYQSELNELNKKWDEVEGEYRQLQEVEEREAAYLKEIKQLTERLVTRQYQHHDEMNQEEKKQTKQNKELDSHNQTRILEVKKNVFQVARDIVVQQKVSNEQKNQQLRTRLVLLQTQLAAIKKQRNDILAKRKDLKINLSINEEELEEYKAVGSLQKAKIKNYKDKIDALKVVIDQQIAKRVSGIAQIKKSRTTESKTLKSRLLQLEKGQEEMKIRIEQMKVLAETILMQREEVEQFFIMALESCRKDIEKEKEGSLAIGREIEGKAYGDKVDIQQLTAKDKQRILTNLYTKLALGP